MYYCFLSSNIYFLQCMKTACITMNRNKAKEIQSKRWQPKINQAVQWIILKHNTLKHNKIDQSFTKSNQYTGRLKVNSMRTVKSMLAGSRYQDVASKRIFRVWKFLFTVIINPLLFKQLLFKQIFLTVKLA